MQEIRQIVFIKENPLNHVGNGAKDTKGGIKAKWEAKSTKYWPCHVIRRRKKKTLSTCKTALSSGCPSSSLENSASLRGLTTDMGCKEGAAKGRNRGIKTNQTIYMEALLARG